MFAPSFSGSVNYMGAETRKGVQRSGPWKLSTRLLLPLVGAVTGVMFFFALWAQLQREGIMLAEARRETEAYATALGLALEGAYRDPDLSHVQDLIDRLSQERTIYAILVYDLQGWVRFASASLERTDGAQAEMISQVIRTGQPISLERGMDGREVFAVLRPFQGPTGAVAGVFEVAQPLSFVQAEMVRTRERFLLNTLALLVVVAGLTSWLVGRLVSRPLKQFSKAVQALGEGEFSYRVGATWSSAELEEMAIHLDEMADHLEKARADLLAESEERLDLERRVQTSEKMAAIGDLAARVGHEIAAPLQVIRGRANMILKADRGPKDRSRQLRIIVQQIDRITLIVRNLLNFARRPEPRSDLLDVSQLLSSVLEFLEGEMERHGVELKWNPPGPRGVVGDPDLLFQVFTNLVMNALQAMSGQEGPRHLSVGVLENQEGREGWVEVLVEDTGPGIPEEALPYVFEPFFTTRTGGAGTGLGLAVALAAVEGMGGKIWVEGRRMADPGERQDGAWAPGTRFCVRLQARGMEARTHV